MDLPGSRSTGPWPVHGPARQTQNIPLPWRPCPPCQARTPGLWGPVCTGGTHSLPARPSGGPAASASAWTRSRPSGPRAPLLPFLSDKRRPHGLSASAVPVTNGHPASLIVLLSVEGNGAHFPGPWRRQGSHPARLSPAMPPFCVPAATTFSYPGVYLQHLSQALPCVFIHRATGPCERWEAHDRWPRRSRPPSAPAPCGAEVTTHSTAWSLGTGQAST